MPILPVCLRVPVHLFNHVLHFLSHHQGRNSLVQTSRDCQEVILSLDYFIYLCISYAFLDIQPLSRGHALVIPKEHAVKFHELSDESLTDILPVAKKVALALGIKDYNLLQNNGTHNP